MWVNLPMLSKRSQTQKNYNIQLIVYKVQNGQKQSMVSKLTAVLSFEEEEGGSDQQKAENES